MEKFEKAVTEVVELDLNNVILVASCQGTDTCTVPFE